ILLWLRDRMARFRRSRPEQAAARRRALERRLLSPDWVFYEQHLQRPVPPALRALYNDKLLLTAQDLRYREDELITTFAPLDRNGLLETRSLLGFDVVAIAINAFGDPIYLRPGASETDIVYITHHDGGDIEVFADSVAAMVAQLRNPVGPRV
ncbi:MAG TPA: hypothetical protein VFL57_01180, partial [Bryobacteraceae bacterium]|nr:hypothetical protein [Bryobacteraceae bacterium]